MNNSTYKIDLHTHSIISHDGGISKKQYTKIIKSGILDYVAITDHNQTGFAKKMQEELGPKIIVGEEVMTKDGEMIGLFLSRTIPAGLSAKETANLIHADGGLVCIPHPFETIRSGLQENTLKEIVGEIDIFEVFNARGIIRGKPDEAMKFALLHNISQTASSDAHCRMGIGSSYAIINEKPTVETLVGALSNADSHKKHAPVISLLCPGVNRIKNKLFLGI